MENKLAQIDIGQQFGSRFGSTAGGGQQLLFGDLVSIILNNAFVVAGAILLLIFVIAGVSMVVGAGQDNPEKAAKARAAAFSAAIGFGIIFASYWIIQIIEFATGVQILNPTF